MGAAEADVTPDAVMENSLTVKVPENLTSAVAKSSIWDEYDKRCIKCGRCTVACPTCTCWSMQDLFYTENGQAGERRRVQASCMIDGYTEVAASVSARKPANGCASRSFTRYSISRSARASRCVSAAADAMPSVPNTFPLPIVSKN